MKRAIFTLLVITAVSIPVFAKYSGGSGTAGDPYQIANAADLLDLAADTNDYDANFILTADIDLDPNLPGNQLFTTAVIASDTNNSNYTFDGTAFTGDFNGNNHTISNLTINTSGAGNDFLGLFGEIDPGGQIINLGLENVSITGGDTSIALGGLVGGNLNGGVTISNCYVAGNVTGGNNSNSLGELVGVNLVSGTINNCYATGTVTGGSGSSILGGLVGFNQQCDISNCYSTGTVTGGSGSSNLGGLMGVNSGGTISNCYSTDAVTGGDSSQRLGGLVGYNDGSISACYSTGAITGTAPLGGLVGRNESGTISNCYSSGNVRESLNTPGIGGVVGDSNHGDISNCYSSGIITIGTKKYTGWLGWDYGGTTISHCYFFKKGSSTIGYSGGKLTAAQMKQQASFVGWDFAGETANGTNDIWWIAEGAGYPKLVWRLEVAKCTVTAGREAGSDKISISGQIGAAADDFTGTIKVTINSFDIVNPCVLTFPINNDTWKVKKGKYSYSGTEDGVKKSFKYDVRTGKFSFTASNVDLCGLACPLIVQIEINSYVRTAEVDEYVVNGPRKPIPIFHCR
jgi:hypothetical protein